MIAAYHAEHPEAPLSWLCAALDANRSWFYERLAAAEPSAEATVLRARIEAIVLEMPGYGYRRVTEQLQDEGWSVNHKRVLRIMREESLLCQLKKRFVVTTDSEHPFRTYPNLLKGTELIRPDQAWQADITYIRLPGGFCYLAALLDSFSRYCVGWHLSRDIDTRLTLAALEMALSRRCPPLGLIHHSDRGVQYASCDYVLRLERAGAQISMSAKGNPYDNAKAESFFKTLKREEVYLKDYQNYQEAEANIGPFIEAVYNQKRLHSRLDYQAPAQFEAAYSLLATELA
jgi:putative transposase